MAVGLVLGAGGVVGGAFHTGVLAAIDEATGWDARSAELIVGTSAGAVMGAVLRAGLSPADQFAHALDRPLSAEGRLIAGRLSGLTDLPAGARLPRVPRPASPPMVAASLMSPWPPRPGKALAGLLPPGTNSTEPIGDRIRHLYDGRGWPDDPLWVCAVRLGDGRRVVFGRDVDDADVGTAVEASLAVPGFMTPVRHGVHSYVDGGAHSPSNADLLAGLGFDVVVVVSAMSATWRAGWKALRPSPTVGNRVIAGMTLDREVKAIRAAGTPVLVVQPTDSDLAVMGTNWMDRSRRGPVAEQAKASTLRRLRHPSVVDLVALLPRSRPSWR
ncbi:MAG: patatin-like phospholipase family protein [Acidimicrobiales bacterium]